MGRTSQILSFIWYSISRMKSIPKRQIAYSDQDTVELDGENKSDS